MNKVEEHMRIQGIIAASYMQWPHLDDANRILFICQEHGLMFADVMAQFLLY